jgi:hypothetical protein
MAVVQKQVLEQEIMMPVNIVKRTKHNGRTIIIFVGGKTNQSKQKSFVMAKMRAKKGSESEE